MLGRLIGIDGNDPRDAWVGFLTLAGMMAGHACLETARDSMFLAKLPATHLPFAYIGIAGLALIATALNRRLLARFSRRAALAATLAVGALVTTGLWFSAGLGVGGTPILYGIYVWGGVLATVVVVQFWSLLGGVFDVGQAKRTFAFIGAGGVVGAAAGSAIATGLAGWFPPRHLLLAAAIAFAITALGAPAFRQPPPVQNRKVIRVGATQPLLGDAYLRRLFLLVVVSTLLVTGIDYVFKSLVASAVPAHELGATFAKFYTVTNVVALLVQVLVAPRLLGSLGVARTQLIMPALLLAGSIAFVASFALASALVLKGIDAALRHSVHRTSTEILYLPLSSSVRDRFKALAEALGQRGGQALASVALLAAAALGASPWHIGLALVVIAAAWLGCIYGIKPYYVARFRDTLRAGSIEGAMGVPNLDLHTLETLIGTLSSEDDFEVIGALEMLARYGKTKLIPALIL